MFIRITWYLLADHTGRLGCLHWSVETFHKQTEQQKANILPNNLCYAAEARQT